MIFRALDAEGDFTFGAGLNNYLRTDAAIGANIQTRLLSWVGDCFFDQLAGIDWVNRLGSKNQRANLELDMRRIILQSEGVTGITSFDTVLAGRTLTASFSVNTIYSQNYQLSVTLGALNA